MFERPGTACGVSRSLAVPHPPLDPHCTTVPLPSSATTWLFEPKPPVAIALTPVSPGTLPGRQSDGVFVTGRPRPVPVPHVETSPVACSAAAMPLEVETAITSLIPGMT